MSYVVVLNIFRYQALLDSEVHPDADASLAKMTGEPFLYLYGS